MKTRRVYTCDVCKKPSENARYHTRCRAERTAERQAARLATAANCPNCNRCHTTVREVDRCEMRWERSAVDVRNWMYRGLTP